MEVLDFHSISKQKGVVMSLMFFDIAKIEQLYSLIEFHLTKVKRIIQCSPYYDQFARKAEHSAGILHLPFEEEKGLCRIATP